MTHQRELLQKINHGILGCMAMVNTSELSHYHLNARRGNITAIAESLATFGQFRPIVVNAGSLTGRPNEILAGNHTYMAAMTLGWETIEVDYVDVDDEVAKKINLIDNRSADLSEYDHNKLQDLMDEILSATFESEEDTVIPEVVFSNPVELAEPTTATVKESKPEVKMADILPNLPIIGTPTAGIVREVPTQVNAAKQGESINDSTEKYLDGATRHLFLEWTVEEFNVVTANLLKLAEHWDLKTNGEVVKRLLGL